MSYELFLAWTHLARKKRTGFISLIAGISVLGVAVGVMALIVVLAVMSGFDRELKDKIVGMNPHIYVEKAGGIQDEQNLVSVVKETLAEAATTVARVVQGQAIVRSEQNAMGVVVRGVDQENGDLKSLSDFIIHGDFTFESMKANGENYYPAIVLGRELARILRVGIGDELTVISPTLEEKRVPFLPKKPETKVFVVRGIFFMGMNDFDTQVALMTLEEARGLYHLGDRVSGISVRLDEVDLADKLKVKVQNVLGYPYVVRSWIDLNYNFFSALKIEKIVMTILLFLIILVAAFNIVSSLMMIVMEKTRDIGLLKSLGATGWNIQKIFLLEGFFVGFLGVAIGTVSGLLIAMNINEIAQFLEDTTGLAVFPSDIYFFSEIPTQIQSFDVCVIVALALVAALLAGVYPAYKAARLEPARALRYE